MMDYSIFHSVDDPLSKIEREREQQQQQQHIPASCFARSMNFSTRTVCITETSRNPVHSKFGRKTSETTHGSISTKCTWKFVIVKGRNFIRMKVP